MRAVQRRPERDRFAHLDALLELRFLKLDADAALQRRDVAQRIEAEHRDAAGVGHAQPLDALHRRRLAGAVGTDQAEDLAVPDVDRDVGQRRHRSVTLREPGDLNDRPRRHALSLSARPVRAVTYGFCRTRGVSRAVSGTVPTIRARATHGRGRRPRSRSAAYSARFGRVSVVSDTPEESGSSWASVRTPSRSGRDSLCPLSERTYADHVQVMVRLLDGQRFRRGGVRFVSLPCLVAQSSATSASRSGAAPGGIIGSDGSVVVAAASSRLPSIIPQDGSALLYASKHEKTDQVTKPLVVIARRADDESHDRVVVKRVTEDCNDIGRAIGREPFESRRHR